LSLTTLTLYDFELYDIFETFKFEKGKWHKKFETIERNIIEILKRERLWNPKLSICFPSGASDNIDTKQSQDRFLEINAKENYQKSNRKFCLCLWKTSCFNS